jgi:hypothetical protein
MFYAILGTVYVVCLAIFALLLLNLKPLGSTRRGAPERSPTVHDAASRSPAGRTREFATHH